ncbi:MAG: hypothetical protein RQ748_12365, partial [Elusimicrobiales bacterium]|nr:hypothetical protein [Elusimicrobiales bacterium]
MGLKSLALWTDPVYAGDAIFDADSPLNRDDCLAPFRALREELASRGWACHTRDVFASRGEVPGAVLFLDIPRRPVRALLG